MATTIISGLLATNDPLSTQLVIDAVPTIRMLDPDTSQFDTMLSDSRISKDKLDSYIKEWWEDRLIPRVVSLAASATSAATTLTTATGEAAYAKTGDILRVVQTGEGVRVTASDGSTSLTVVRGWGGTTAATAASGSNTMIIVQGSNEQGARRPKELVTQHARNYNYSGITRVAWFFTRTAIQSAWQGTGNLLMFERQKKATEFKTDRENTLFFGARAYSAAGPTSTGPLHTAGGLIEYISTNVTSTSALSRSALQDFLTTGLQSGSDSKVFFVSPKIAQVLSYHLENNWIQAPPGTKLWGAKVDFVLSGAFGSPVPVIVKRQWGAYGTGSSGNYGSIAFLVDMKSVRRAVMQDAVLHRDIQENDEDGVAEEYLCEDTLVVQQETHHSILKNVTTYV